LLKTTGHFYYFTQKLNLGACAMLLV